MTLEYNYMLSTLPLSRISILPSFHGANMVLGSDWMIRHGVNLDLAKRTFWLDDVMIVNRSSDSFAEYRRQQASNASLRPCTLKRGSTTFFARRNKATSRFIVLNTLPLAYDKIPLTSKQDADISPTISIQCHFGLVL